MPTAGTLSGRRLGTILGTTMRNLGANFATMIEARGMAVTPCAAIALGTAAGCRASMGGISTAMSNIMCGVPNMGVGITLGAATARSVISVARSRNRNRNGKGGTNNNGNSNATCWGHFDCCFGFGLGRW